LSRMSEKEQNEFNEKIPEGMVRKTRRVRKRREKPSGGSSDSKENANSLFAKAKDLLIGMQDEGDDYGPVDLAEQVRRLKKNKEDDRPLDDVWGTNKRSSSWLWIVLVGLIGSVVAIVVGIANWAKDDPRIKESPVVNIDVGIGALKAFKPGDGPLGWFNENSIKVLDEAVEIINVVNKAEKLDSIEKMIRDSPFRALNPIKLESWGYDLLTNPLSKFSWTPMVVYSSEISGAKERGYLRVSGTRQGGEPFQAFFVNEDEKLLLDWDATTGWSEMGVAEIVEKIPRKPIFLRCLVEKKTSFDQSFGQIEYSGYVLTGDASDEYILAYVPLDTDRSKTIDRDFKLMLKYGSFVTDEPPLKNQKATVRVRHLPGVGEKGIFEIVEFLHSGWVSP